MTIFELAEEVKNELNASPWSQDFQATRDFKPVYEYENLADDELQVSVVAREYTPSSKSRAVRMRDDQIDISIIKKVDESPEEKTEKDALGAFAEAVTKYFYQWESSGPACFSAVYSPLYMPESLYKAKVFFGLITLSFRGLDNAS